MWAIGDVHSCFTVYSEVQQGLELPARPETMRSSVQLGDLGLLNEEDQERLKIEVPHYFFRGNHDNPDLCDSHPNYLGDYGYIDKGDMFWLSGAKSSDYRHRFLGNDLFEREELSLMQLTQAIQMYTDKRPSVVLSHECPSVMRDIILEVKGRSRQPGEAPSRTERALQEMFDAHRPDLWVFGHHHIRHEGNVGGVKFVCLNEFRYCDTFSECLFEIPEFDL